MTKLTIVARNPNPSPTHHNPPTLRLVSNDCHDGARLRFEKEMATVRGDGLVSRRFNDCKDWRDVLEVMDEICWVVPPSEEEREERKREEWNRLVGTALMLAETDRRFKTDPDFRHWLTEKARREGAPAPAR